MGPLAVAVLGLRYRKDMPALQIHLLNNQRCHDMPLSLFPQELLDLTDLALHFAGYLFSFAFGLQPGIMVIFPAVSLTLPFAS